MFSLARIVCNMAVVVQRLCTQDYTSLPAYFTDRDWSCMLDSTQPAQLRTEVVFKKAAALGLKAANEPTSAVLTAMYLIASESTSGARETHPSLKHETLKVVKRQYRKFVADHADELTFTGPPKLPSLPAEFHSAFPEAWATSYCDDKPSEAPAVTGLAVQQIALSVPLRSTNLNVRQSQRPDVSMQPCMSFQPQQQQMMMQQMMNSFMQNCMGFRMPQDNPPIMRRLASRLQPGLPDIGITYLSTPTPAAIADFQPSTDSTMQPLQPTGLPHTPQPPASPTPTLPHATQPLASPTLPIPAEVHPKKKTKSATEVTQSLLLCINSNDATKARKRKKTKKEKKSTTKKVESKVKSSPAQKKSSSKCTKKEVKAKELKAKWTVQPPQDLLKKFAEGCSSCRKVKGCTPSCWRKRGF